MALGALYAQGRRPQPDKSRAMYAAAMDIARTQHHQRTNDEVVLHTALHAAMQAWAVCCPRYSLDWNDFSRIFLSGLERVRIINRRIVVGLSHTEELPPLVFAPVFEVPNRDLTFFIDYAQRMPPEFFQAIRKFQHLADAYLAIVFYHLLCVYANARTRSYNNDIDDFHTSISHSPQ
jgi:hypothetical protein